MRLLTLLLLAFALLGPLTTCGIGAGPRDVAETQLILEIKLFEQATPDLNEKVRSNPTIVVTVGRPFQFHVGGEIPSNHGGDDLLIGTQVRGRVDRAPNDQYRLALSIGVGKQLPHPGDDADVVRTEMLDIRTKIASQKTKQFRYSYSEWCSVSLQSVAPEERAIQAR